jgi:hypothetical protein
MNSKRVDSSFLKFLLSTTSSFFNTCAFASLITVATLTGCGGGDASTTSTENNLPSPVAGGINGDVLVPGPAGESPVPPETLDSLPQVSVGPRQFADPNVLLNLHGTAVAVKGATIVKTLWTQVTGPQVIIPSPQALDNIILVPDVSVATQLEFRLTAQDSLDRINSATISIFVKPVPTFVKVIGGVFNEASGPAIFKVRLNAPSTTPITVSYITQDASAKSNSDYVANSGQVIFAAGEVVKEIPVTLINDVINEGDESFSLQVTAIDGTTTHANTGVAIIRNGTEPQLTQSIQFTDKGTVSIYAGDQYTNAISPAAPGSGDIIYSSSNSSVASVNAKGVVTGSNLGTATITATKLADDVYLSATNSYTLQVISRGTTPSVSIEQQDGYSVELGETVDLFGYATDQEDGALPTAAQIAANAASGKPITSLSWSSNVDGFLGYGESLDINTLSMGTHLITYSATDNDGNTGTASIRVLVGNIAPGARVGASSTYCTGGDCYDVNRVNDTSLSTALGNAESWVNDTINTPVLPQTVTLDWPYPVFINSLSIYSTSGYVMRDYDIEYFDGNTWILLYSVTNNAAVTNTFTVPIVTTSSLRVLAKKGSTIQPQYARINEIVVFGTVSGTSGP